MSSEIELYKEKHGSYPTSLTALIEAGMLLDRPLDTCFNELSYLVPGKHNPNTFDLWSIGCENKHRGVFNW